MKNRYLADVDPEIARTVITSYMSNGGRICDMIDMFVDSDKTVQEIVHHNESLTSVRAEYGNVHNRLKKLQEKNPERYGKIRVVTREGKIYIFRLEA